MSVAGFDLGDQSSCIAVARKKGIDVLLNKESNRETPSVLTFNSKARLLGTDALGSLAVNPKNAVSQVKRLLGKKFSAPSVQADIKNLLFEVVAGPDDRYVFTGVLLIRWSRKPSDKLPLSRYEPHQTVSLPVSRSAMYDLYFRHNITQ